MDDTCEKREPPLQLKMSTDHGQHSVHLTSKVESSAVCMMLLLYLCVDIMGMSVSLRHVYLQIVVPCVCCEGELL